MYSNPRACSLLTSLLLLASGLLLSACATNPVTGDSDFVLMSEDDEIRLGHQHSTAALAPGELGKPVRQGNSHLYSVVRSYIVLLI